MKDDTDALGTKFNVMLICSDVSIICAENTQLCCFATFYVSYIHVSIITSSQREIVH